MSRPPQGSHERILIVDTGTAFRNRLAEQLRLSGFEVVTAATGESAFYLLHNSRHAIDWLYTRADLPGLIDGWILADEYHGGRSDRRAVIAASNERVSGQGHVVLKDPSLAAALNAIHSVAITQKPAVSAGADPQSRAA